MNFWSNHSFKELNIWSCGLHDSHGASKSVALSYKWDIVRTFKSNFSIFVDAKARWSDYLAVTKSDLFPKSFCFAAWLKVSDVTERDIEVFGNILKMVKFLEPLLKNVPNCHHQKLVIIKNISNCCRYNKWQYLFLMAFYFNFENYRQQKIIWNLHKEQSCHTNFRWHNRKEKSMKQQQQK